MNLKYLIVFVLILILIPSVNAATCTVRNSTIDTNICATNGEECIFSMFSQINAHISKCGTPFYDLNVCCTSDPEPANFTATGCYVNTTASTVYSTDNEVSSSGTGYATGGQALDGQGVSVPGSNTATVDFTNEVFSSGVLVLQIFLLYI